MGPLSIVALEVVRIREELDFKLFFAGLEKPEWLGRCPVTLFPEWTIGHGEACEVEGMASIKEVMDRMEAWMSARLAVAE